MPAGDARQLGHELLRHPGAPARPGSAHPNLAPYQAYPANDGYFVVAVGNDGLWEKLCTALERPELATDVRFLRNRDRIEHRSELDEVLTAAFATGTVQHWCRVLEDHDVPVSPIRHLDEIYGDPHTAAIGMVGTVDHPSGPLEQIAFPVNFGGQRPPLRSAPPLHGEHTDDILAGYQEVTVPS